MSAYLAGTVIVLLALPLVMSFLISTLHRDRRQVASPKPDKARQVHKVPTRIAASDEGILPIVQGAEKPQPRELHEAEYVGRSLAEARRNDATQSADSLEGQQVTEREYRLGRDKRRELVRSALRGTAVHGYYVFDNLMSEQAGMLDFLAVGPDTICAIIVRDEPGAITALPDRTVLLDGRRFSDDPREQAHELRSDVISRLSDTDKPIDYLICFTRADIYSGKDLAPYQGLCTVWTLAWSFDAEDDQALNEAEVAEYAELIQQIYGRPPFVTPEGGNTF